MQSWASMLLYQNCLRKCDTMWLLVTLTAAYNCMFWGLRKWLGLTQFLGAPNFGPAVAGPAAPTLHYIPESTLQQDATGCILKWFTFDFHLSVLCSSSKILYSFFLLQNLIVLIFCNFWFRMGFTLVWHIVVSVVC